MIDNNQPDLLYSDSRPPFEEVGRAMVANFCNPNIATRGSLQAVYNCRMDPSLGRWVRDIERGVSGEISVDPWQTDTSIGDWFHRSGQKCMTAGEVVRMLTDMVKIGKLLLNVVQIPEGDLEPDVLAMLDGIGNWRWRRAHRVPGPRECIQR